ncbi:MAG: hypothetical protein EOM37_07375 [Proteobacteria bacterium]|nr:hypothetical protein [Pseudomonadota bacterium]
MAKNVTRMKKQVLAAIAAGVLTGPASYTGVDGLTSISPNDNVHTAEAHAALPQSKFASLSEKDASIPQKGSPIYKRFMENSQTICNEINTAPDTGYMPPETLNTYRQYCGTIPHIGTNIDALHQSNADYAFQKLFAPKSQGGLQYYPGNEPPFSLGETQLLSNDMPMAFLGMDGNGLTPDQLTMNMDNQFNLLMQNGAGANFQSYLDKHKTNEPLHESMDQEQIRINATAMSLDYLKKIPDATIQAQHINLLGNSLLKVNTKELEILSNNKAVPAYFDLSRTSGTPESIMKSGEATCTGNAAFKLGALRALGHDPKDLWVVVASQMQPNGEYLHHAIPGIVINGEMKLMNNNTLPENTKLFEENGRALRDEPYPHIIKGLELTDTNKFFGPRDETDSHNTGYTPLGAFNLKGQKLKFNPSNEKPQSLTSESEPPPLSKESQQHLGMATNTILKAHDLITSDDTPQQRSAWTRSKPTGFDIK